MIKVMKRTVWIGVALMATACLDTEVGISPIEQLNRDIVAIDSYLFENGITALKDATGIRIAIDELGTDGLPPNTENNVKVTYTGKLLSNGSTFDSGTITGKLTDWITGWQIGLSLLPAGSKATLYIPSGYAYGTRGQGSIPPDAILVFDVEIESVSLTLVQATRLASDKTAIDNYLEENEIEAIVHESGIRYVITEEGSGTASPSLYQQVKIGYVGKLLATNHIFINQEVEPNNDFSSRVVNFPHGVLIGLQLMKEGDKATLYVPSTLAYGARSYTDVPSNSNIIYEIELIEVK
ncbi:MAG: FKBP-type peptidyl-prolyl cis-trans isomerase [Cyclobacteriaceae bacterium]|nr:FKBP-type peptidyl-prolyl cis-trans isomerase [Cyclobacteriaceae bacterium]